MVGRVHRVGEVGQQVVERFDRLARMEVERGNAAQGDLGDDAECAEPDARDAQQLGIVLLVGPHDRAVAGDQLDADDRGGDVAEPRPRAVRRGRGGARYRLAIDVAEIRHGESPLGEARVEFEQPDAGLHRDVVPLDAQHTVHRVEREQVAVGHRGAGERVAGADRLHAFAGRPGGTNDRRDLAGRCGLVHRYRYAPLVTRPIPRRDAHPASVGGVDAATARATRFAIGAITPLQIASSSAFSTTSVRAGWM